jgi:hypothetical protein
MKSGISAGVKLYGIKETAGFMAECPEYVCSDNRFFL